MVTKTNDGTPNIFGKNNPDNDAVDGRDVIIKGGGKSAGSGDAGSLRLEPGEVTGTGSGDSGFTYLGETSVATDADGGFPTMPGNAGAPTGAPSPESGQFPFYYDSSNDEICVYNSSWRCVAVAAP
jgi:hypothetical protein